MMAANCAQMQLDNQQIWVGSPLCLCSLSCFLLTLGWLWLQRVAIARARPFQKKEWDDSFSKTHFWKTTLQKVHVTEMSTIEAVTAKAAGPRARALQTPAAFSPTPEIHWIRLFLLINSPTHLPQASHSPLARLGTLGFSSRTTEEDISFILPLFPISSVLCNYVQCQAASLWASKSSGHFLQWRKRMIMAQEWNSSSRFFLPKLCLTFLIWQRDPSRSVRWWQGNVSYSMFWILRGWRSRTWNL